LDGWRGFSSGFGRSGECGGNHRCGFEDPARSKSAFEFFRWALENGQKQASDLDYVPLPAGLVQQIDGYWKSEFAVTN
jgi:hypothetical protein